MDMGERGWVNKSIEMQVWVMSLLGWGVGTIKVGEDSEGKGNKFVPLQMPG